MGLERSMKSKTTSRALKTRSGIAEATWMLKESVTFLNELGSRRLRIKRFYRKSQRT
jgi:hypothetical protein